MTTKNLSIKYYISLVSDIAKKSDANAKALENATKRQNKALEQTEKAATKTDKAVTAVGQATSVGKVEGDAKRATAALDQTTAAARRANDALNRVGTGRSSFERTNGFLSGVARRLDDVRRKAAQAGEGVRKIDGVASGAVAGGVVAAAMVRRPMSFDARLADMANVAYADEDLKGRIAGMNVLEAKINESVRTSGGSRDTAAEALNEMIASGVVKTNEALQMLPDLQRAATASGADVTQLTQIAIRAMQNFGLKADQIPEALSKAIKAGQEGGFELKDMAKWLPQMMAVSKGMLGMRGMSGFEKLISASQASVITAGTKDEAGNNMVNLLAKINSQDTKKDFEKVGIDLTASLVKAQKQGFTPLEAFVSFVEQVAAKDKDYVKLKKQADAAGSEDEKKPILDAMADTLQGSAIGQVIQDRQALMALIALMQNKDYVKKVEAQVKGDTGQARESNFELISSRAGFKAQQASNEADIARSNTFKQVDGPLQSLLTGATNLAREFPVLTTVVTGAVAAIGIWKAASIGAGLSSLLRGKPAAAAAAAAVSAAPAFNPFGSLGGTPVPQPAAKVGFLGRAGGLLRKAGWLGAAGYTAYDVGSTLMDSDKTAAEKTNAIGRTAAGVAGGWAGAKAGALAGGALGSFVPIIGTGIGAAVGGLVGGGLGWWGAQKLGDSLANNPAMQPTAAANALREVPPQKVDIDLKEGRLAVAVTVSDMRTQVNTSVVQQLNGVRIDAGSTNPAGRQ